MINIKCQLKRYMKLVEQKRASNNLRKNLNYDFNNFIKKYMENCNFSKVMKNGENGENN